VSVFLLLYFLLMGATRLPLLTPEVADTCPPGQLHGATFDAAAALAEKHQTTVSAGSQSADPPASTSASTWRVAVTRGENGRMR
jgi:hypothetical protein